MSRKDKQKNSTEDGFGAICKDMGTGEVIIDMCKLMCKEEQLQEVGISQGWKEEGIGDEEGVNGKAEHPYKQGMRQVNKERRYEEGIE